MYEQMITSQVGKKKETRVNLPPSWTVLPLGRDTIAYISSGGTPDRLVPEYFRGGIKWVKSGELKDNIICETEETISQKGLENSAAKVFPAGTLLVAMYGATVGMTGLLGTEAAVNQAICAIVTQGNIIDNCFLQLYFIKNRQKLLNARSGGAQPNINQRIIRSLEVILPPLPEQRAIAHILQTIQNAIQSRRRELELERERKAALMQHLFTRGTRGEATKQTEIGEVPESWELTRLGEIGKVRYGLGQPPQKADDGIPMIRATDIKNGCIMTSAVMRVKDDAIPAGRAYFLQRGDIIVVRSGVYAGDVAMYNGYWERAIAGYDLVVTPTDNNILSPFLSYYLQGEANQRYFHSQRDRSAQPHINADQLSNALIPLPFKDEKVDKEEQEKISYILVLCDSKIAALEKEIALQEELFRALLEELMSGRLSALPLVEEPGREG